MDVPGDVCSEEICGGGAEEGRLMSELRDGRKGIEERGEAGIGDQVIDTSGTHEWGGGCGGGCEGVVVD